MTGRLFLAAVALLLAVGLNLSRDLRALPGVLLRSVLPLRRFNPVERIVSGVPGSPPLDEIVAQIAEAARIAQGEELAGKVRAQCASCTWPTSSASAV
jgi:hypothetical protein